MREKIIIQPQIKNYKVTTMTLLVNLFIKIHKYIKKMRCRKFLVKQIYNLNKFKKVINNNDTNKK
jgi:hypothetical protein